MKSKHSRTIPGKNWPVRADFPGQRVWGIVIWLIGLPLAAGAGVVIASKLFGDIKPGSIGALVGMVIAYKVLQGIQKEHNTKKGRNYYKQLVEREPNNADACVQAGLWIHETTTIPEEIREGDQFYRKALQISPGHRDAIVMLTASLFQARKLKEVIELIEPWLAERRDLIGETIAAKALKDLGQHERAVIYFSRILEISPEIPMKSEIEQYLAQHTNKKGG